MAQNLTGWRLDSERGAASGQVFGFPAGLIMQPGQVCRVYTDEVHPEWCRLSFGYRKSGVWNNTEPDAAVLFDGDGAVFNSGYDFCLGCKRDEVMASEGGRDWGCVRWTGCGRCNKLRGTGRTPPVAQADATQLGSWLRGIVHMAEPAEGSSHYQYRAAGRPFPGLGALAARWASSRARSGLSCRGDLDWQQAVGGRPFPRWTG